MTRPSFLPRIESLEAREVPAALGALDPSFGTAGKTTTDFGFTDAAAAVAIQSDGKIVVAGSDDGGSANFAVARYNPDGSPDTTFGGGDGKVDFTFGGADFATSVAIQSDGKIVVAGYTNNAGNDDFAVLRVLADGSGLDTTFDADGKQTVAFDLGGTNEDRAAGVAIQSDGKIVLVGSVQRVAAGDFDFGVARLNADGSPDLGFNGTGRRQVAFDLGPAGSREDRATSVSLQTDGKIVVAGFAQVSTTERDFAAARVNADGTTDNSFDADGKQTIDFGFDDRAAAVAIQSDGKIVLAGADDGGAADFAVARLTTAGAPDTAGFNPTGAGAVGSAPGRLTFNFGSLGVVERANAVALQPDGKIVLAGFTALNGVVGNPNNFAAARVTADGALDPSFDADGRATVDFGGDDQGAGVALDPNGRVVVVGKTGTNFAVARLIGSVEKGGVLAVGGQANGSAQVFAPTAAGLLPAAATGIAAPFGASNANVRTATGDVNGDGFDDTILVTGPGPIIQVAVVSGKDNVTVLVNPFDPFGGFFTGGGFVAAGDFDGDGRAEFVVTPDQGGGPRVSIFSLPVGATTQALRANFFGIDDPNFRGGARAAVGDVDGDGTPDLAIAAGFGGGPRVALFDGGTVFGTPTRLTGDFFAFGGSDAVNLRNGAFVAAGDVDGDGFADLAFGGGPGGGPRVFVLSGALVSAGNVGMAQAAPISNFFVAGNGTDRGGVRLALSDLDGDGKADLIAGSGEGSAAAARAYLGKNVTSANEPATFQDLSLFGGGVLTGGVFVG